MYALEHTTIQCPYCWERLNISVDPGEQQQTYTEDCQICCQPMVIDAYFDENRELHVTVRREND